MNTGFTFLHVPLFVQWFHMALRGRTKTIEKLITENDIQDIEYLGIIILA